MAKLVDASYSSDLDDRKSYSRSLFILSGRLILWSFQKQRSGLVLTTNIIGQGTEVRY